MRPGITGHLPESDRDVARHRFLVWVPRVLVVHGWRPRLCSLAMVRCRDGEKASAASWPHWKWGDQCRFMEGLNTGFSATKRKARGYVPHPIITMLYFVQAQTPLPQI